MEKSNKPKMKLGPKTKVIFLELRPKNKIRTKITLIRLTHVSRIYAPICLGRFEVVCLSIHQMSQT